MLAQIFLDNVFKLHGMPATIVSDRDVVFTSKFWQELFRLQGTVLALSTAYHPQTDGQTEVVNRCLEGYLRCVAGERPKTWAQWLPLAEWWFNTTFHSSIRLTPYQAVYGQPPPSLSSYIPGATNVDTVDQWGKDRQATLRILKEHLSQAQNRMKQLADKHRTERVFQVGDWVYLRLQPYKQATVQFRANNKLSPRFYGPYQIIQKVGQVAYKLRLPPSSHIHPVFHVSLLKKKLGQLVAAQVELPPVTEEGILEPEPIAILERKLVKYKGRPAMQILVQWANTTPEEATWEFYTHIQAKFPTFLPCGQGSH